MTHAIKRFVIGGMEFWVVRDGQGGYVINDNINLPRSLTEQTYCNLARAHEAVRRYWTRDV